jgi:hypothetical protein
MMLCRERQRAGVDDGGVESTYRVGCGEVGERRRGGGWLMGSRGSDCAKGVVSGQWVAAGEGVEVSGGGCYGVFLLRASEFPTLS